MFSVSGAGGSKTLVAITDYLGRASLPPTGLPPGTYAVSASFAGNATYQGRTASLPDLNIAPQTIDFGPAGGGGGLPASITVPGTATFTVTTNAGQPVTVGLEPTPSPPGPYCTLSSTQSAGVTTYTLTAVAPGTCTLVASAGGTPTFASVTVTQPVIIKGDQAINFGVLADKTYGDAPFTVAATGGASGNPVTFASQTASVCAVSGDVVTILAAGTCTIAADQAGATNYNAAPQVTRSFTVNKAAQTITFGSLGAKTFGDAPFAVSATASSGLAVTFGSGGSCSVSGSTVTITGAGSCTITASQAGDGNYQPATSVPQTFAIGQAAQTIAFTPVPAQTWTPGRHVRPDRDGSGWRRHVHVAVHRRLHGRRQHRDHRQGRRLHHPRRPGGPAELRGGDRAADGHHQQGGADDQLPDRNADADVHCRRCRDVHGRRDRAGRNRRVLVRSPPRSAPSAARR